MLTAILKEIILYVNASHNEVILEGFEAYFDVIEEELFHEMLS